VEEAAKLDVKFEAKKQDVHMYLLSICQAMEIGCSWATEKGR